ncbi:hypothetical protein EIN_026920 [Entamoeba invadens IP1]|uniref:hypothetical protein n=1 Tax=Entamoeba invadens IP1 TaxID=370355 RepID=UPI0002C3FB97|nr:hypothetical protein EIN_026920 [Entamoeba invadens IP1]ELP90813.1 hypothetical protein EIN_026920 [Entamoeba invadens IP1]|eukprot:XP_004257584.1 hypothetical protein EIN_026920 [Entamoeba invadens IP1]
MGICFECKKSTDLYCVHHKKHVCIDCMFKTHAVCTMSKYKDYVMDNKPEVNECPLCKAVLGDKEVVRLPCLCVVHKECIVKEFDDATGELKCPQCQTPVFVGKDDIPTQIKEHLLAIFAGKKYIQPFLDANLQTIAHEDIDTTTQLLLKPEDEKEEQNVSYTKNEISSLKKVAEATEVNVEAEDDSSGPHMNDTDTSDEEDAKKKLQGSLGMGFVATLGHNKRISGRGIFIILVLMVVLVLFMVIVYFFGNTDT